MTSYQNTTHHAAPRRPWHRVPFIIAAGCAAAAAVTVAVAACGSGKTPAAARTGTPAAAQAAGPVLGQLCKTPGATAANGALKCSNNGVWEISGATSSASSASSANPAPPAAPQYTAAQQQAIDAAEGYLSDGQGFSRAGLIQQLSSPDGNGFSVAVATFAVNHVQVNWRQQAIDAANGYLGDGEGFSYAGLIQQLSSPEGNQFSVAVATYAVNHVQVNWDQQAHEAAEGYMSDGEGFSYSSMVQQLESPYGNQFTPAQAEYGAQSVGL